MDTIRSLLNKYKDIPVQVKAAVWFTVCSILQNGLHLITMPIYTRILTTEQYGLSTLYFAWADIVVVFTSLKLAVGVFNNGMVHFPDDRDRFQSSMQGLSLVSALICFGIYIAFSGLFDSLFGLPHILMIAMFIYCIFFPALPFWSARQRYEYKYIGSTIATLGMAIVSSLFSVLFALFSEDKGVMKLILSSSIINIGFFIYIFAKGKTFYNKKYWSYALKFNLPLIPHFLSMIVLNQCDRIMIANMCGESKAAVYGVAYNIGKIALIITSAITSSFTPWMYEKLKSKDYKDTSKISFSLFMLVAGVVVGILLFGPEVIRIFATEEYMQAVYVIPPIAASAFFTFVYNQVSTVEFFFGKSQYIMAASIVGALINIILNYFAITKFGFIAAAYTSLICYILFAICHFSLMRMLCRKNSINTELFDLKKLLLLSAAMIAISIIANFLYAFNIIRYILICMLVITVIWQRKRVFSIVIGLKKK